MQEMYEMIMKHKRAMADMQMIWEKAIRDHQHEYDSDEEVDERAGTWEHRLRKMEMEKTRGKVWPSAPKIALSSANPGLMKYARGGCCNTKNKKSCLCFSRVGRIFDRNGQRQTLYWRLPAT